MAVLLIINNVGISINAGVSVKNWLIKVYVIKDVFEILVVMSEFDKSCDIDEYLHYENCICRKKLVDKLIECSSTDECNENVEEVKIAKVTSTELHSPENENKHECSSCTVYIVLISVVFTANVGIGSYFFYFHWYSKKDAIPLSLVLAL